MRTERQLSQKALAEQLQLAGYEFSDLTVLRIEQGTRFVPDYEVVALAEFFHVSCEYLLGVRNEKFRLQCNNPAYRQALLRQL